MHPNRPAAANALRNASRRYAAVTRGRSASGARRGRGRPAGVAGQYLFYSFCSRVGFTARRRPVAGGSRPRYHPALAESEHALRRATAAKPAMGINPRAWLVI